MYVAALIQLFLVRRIVSDQKLEMAIAAGGTG